MTDEGGVETWSPDEIDAHYTMGHCHYMALALRSVVGGDLAIIWNVDPGVWQVEPDDDGLGGVREVVHVYLDMGDGTVLDVRGRRSFDAMIDEFAPGGDRRFCLVEPLTDETLNALVNDSGNLPPCDGSCIEEALLVANVLPQFWGLLPFPRPM